MYSAWATTYDYGYGSETPQDEDPNFSRSLSNVILTDKFKCYKCTNYVFPPLFVCTVGHFICHTCSADTLNPSYCSACRTRAGAIRDLENEKLVRSVPFPCKFRNEDCTQMRLPHDMKNHEDHCEYNLYACPGPEGWCKFRGPMNSIETHLRNAHNYNVVEDQMTGFLIFNINGHLQKPMDWCMMQVCHGSHFLLILRRRLIQKHDIGGRFSLSKSRPVEFYGLAMLIGTKEEAEKFQYKFEVKSCGRCITWQGIPASLVEGIEPAILNRDCMTIGLPTLMSYAKDNDSVAINVTISPVVISSWEKYSLWPNKPSS